MDAKLIAEKTLKEFPYDFRAFTVDGFLSFVSEKRGRQIIATPWTMPQKVFGAWLSDDEEPKEYIFYRDNVPAIHQIHIQLHELSHYLLGHPTLRINRQVIAEVLNTESSLPFDDLLKLRSPDHNPAEIEAETLANLIQETVIRHYRLDQLIHDLSSEQKFANFLTTMGLT